jgi:hypothetical protein
MKKTVSFFFLFLFSLNCLGLDCKEPVSLLNEGDKSPCTGFLFSPEAEKKASKTFDDLRYTEEVLRLQIDKNNLLLDQARIQDERLALYMQASTDLAKELQRKDSEDFWQKALYFGLGIAVTSLAVYGAASLK